MGSHGPLDRKVTDDVVDRVSRALRETLAGVSLPVPASETPASLPDAVAAVRAATAQPEILRALLRGASLAGARAALFVGRGDQLKGWEGVGFDDDPAIGGVLRGIHLDRSQPAVATVFEENRAVHAEAGGPYAVPDFGQTIRGEAFLVPILVQDRIAGLLYADPGSSSRPVDRRGIEVLAVVAGLAVERGVLSRALAQAGAPAARSELMHSGAHARPAASGAYGRQAAPAAPAPPAAPAQPARAAAPPRESAPGAAKPAPVPVHPAPVAPAPPAPSATPEIEDARRYARLLMEEILLYHGDRVRDGVAHHDLASRLGDELQKARQLYDIRVDARVRDTGDYFEEALVRVLAQGDPRALGAAQGHLS